MSEFDPTGTGDGPADPASPLSAARRGFAGVIVEVKAGDQSGGLSGSEIERRLLEMGFVEGAPVHLVHEGVFGRDPIAVRLADRTVALRRREARAVMVRAAP
ncbi:MAG: FeoA family protein [Caulobacteraceae bacterium]